MVVELIDQRIRDHILNRPDMNKSFEIRMSTAGFCGRMMDYDWQMGKKRPSFQSAVRMLTGEPFHDFWRVTLSEIFGDGFKYAEEEIATEITAGDETIRVPGHADGYLQEFDCITEVKSVSSSTFSMVNTQGTPLASHYEQGNIYADTIGAAWILFIYHNRDSGEYCLLMAPRSAELAASTKAKWVQRVLNKRAGVIADRPYSDSTGSPCWFCDWKDECYKGFASEVAAMTTAELVGVEMVIAKDYVGHRASRLESEKLEAKKKVDLIDALVKQKINQAMVNGLGKFILKVGKNNNPLLDYKPEKEKA